MAELLIGTKPKINIYHDEEERIPYVPGVKRDLIDQCSQMITKDAASRPFIHNLLANDLFQGLLAKYEPVLPNDQLLFKKSKRSLNQEEAKRPYEAIRPH
jgi:hypothetical protein